MKLNFGCGTNRIAGWNNHDADVDITNRLPYASESAGFVFAEHVVEHVTYAQALGFFAECHRVLRSGGICRIAVPSVERVMIHATPEYCEFTKKWAVERRNDVRGAMSAIIFAHGHKQPWTLSLLQTSLFYAGFSRTDICAPGCSMHEQLRGVEGHGRVIGDEFNQIETIVVEATK